jgi:hypothetical protein
MKVDFGGGGKGSDEEHITYSGGKEIFDLLQCGWGERKMKKKKKENVIKYKIWEIVKYDKMKILMFDKILWKDNIIIFRK